MNAQFQLGRKYHIGDGVERDGESRFWYQSCSSRSAKATNNLGVLYEHGHVAPRMSTVQ